MRSRQSGVAVTCNLDGTVKRVVFDGLQLADRIPPGTPVQCLADPASQVQFERFLADIREHGAAFNREIGVEVGDTRMVLYLAGGQTGASLLFIACYSGESPYRINDELMRINNDQANGLRMTAKELALAQASLRRDDEAVFADLSRVNNEMANLQREIASKNVELARLNAQMNRLLGMAAHDLRTPLGVILSYSDFLAVEAQLTQEQHGFVATIRDTSEFMLQVIGDLLDISVIEAGRLDLTLCPVDLVALVRANAALNGILAAQKQISLALDVPERPLVLAIDERRITQVLNNLIGNAIKFSHPGTCVLVAVTALADGAAVAVRDQGLGIPPHELSKLFQPFGTASVRGTSGERSVGLGLAIARRVVEAHGGSMTVESQVGMGSTFTFSLTSAPAGG